MTLDITKSLEIIETMENYISMVRPPANIRHELDIGYEIIGQSILLHEIQPSYVDPSKTMRSPYAKTTFIKKKSVWKIFWMRASLKWESYQPAPFVGQLQDFLRIVEEDEYGCFKG